MTVSPNATTSVAERYVLRYRSLRNEHRVFIFPCDPKGMVQMDELSDRQFNDYLFARGMVGFEFGPPEVLRGELHPTAWVDFVSFEGPRPVRRFLPRLLT